MMMEDSFNQMNDKEIGKICFQLHTPPATESDSCYRLNKKRETVGLIGTQLRSHLYHVQYLLSSRPVLQEQCLPVSGTPQGGVSNPGCRHICSWGLCGTHACVNERPGWRKHSQLHLLTLLPQLTPRIPPFPPRLASLQ